MSPTKAATSAASNPLSKLSPNTTSPSKPTKSLEKCTLPAEPGAGKDEKQIPRFDLNTNTRLAHGAAGTYISPSDAIRSPTSKKLSEIKGKRFQSGKPQTLFAKTLSMQGLKAQEKKES